MVLFLGIFYRFCRMRIVFFAFKLNFEAGGGSTVELDTKMRALQKRGHEVSIVTLFSDQNKLSAGLPYKVYAEQLSSADLLHLQRGVVLMLQKYASHTDRFHLEGHFAYGGGWYRKSRGKVKTIVHFNRELSSFPETTRSPLKFGLSECKRRIRLSLECLFGFPLINQNDLLTFTSPILQQVYVDYGVNTTITAVVPDFFSASDVNPKIGELRKDLKVRDFANGPIQLLSGGRMVKEKGFDIIIRAFAQLPERGRFALILTGDGPEKASLISLATDLRVLEQIQFLGWLSKEELYARYRSSDLYIVPRWRPVLSSMLRRARRLAGS